MKCFFCGDITLEDFSENDGIFIDEPLKKIIGECDIVCGNLEGPIVDNISISQHPKIGPCICNYLGSVDRIKQAGFNLLALANNHIMDYGKLGLDNTIRLLGNNDIQYMGAGFSENEIYRIISYYDEKEKVSIGIINVAGNEFGCSCDGKTGFAWIFYDKVYQLICSARKKFDYLVVVSHMGEETWSVPLPEVRQLYRRIIDLGVSTIIAHHPHVIQGKEVYKGKNIYYSLGDFSHDWRFSVHKSYQDGLCVILDVTKKGIEVTELTTCHDGFRICIKDDSSLLCERSELLLNNNLYSLKVDELCVKYYTEFYKQYYASIVGLDINDKEKQKKYGIHRMNGDEIPWNDLMLFHNVAIESHRWCVCRAIRIMRMQGE